MHKKDFISVLNLSKNIVEDIFYHANILRKKHNYTPLTGKTLALIFEKPSLRTRVTFELAMKQLGGQCIYLTQWEIQMGKRESISDIARNLSRWVDGIVVRTYSQKTVEELANCASIPVINGLTDDEHPSQVLSDFYTILQKKGRLKGIKLVFIGDGNNVCNSLMLLGARMGTNVTVITPRYYAPKKNFIIKAQIESVSSGAKVVVTDNLYTGARDADVIYTDVWTSMGKEKEREKRKKDFKRYQVNSLVLSYAKKDCIVMHCLPARRGEEITNEVMDGPQAVIFDQAENRLHVQKALLKYLLKG